MGEGQLERAQHEQRLGDGKEQGRLGEWPGKSELTPPLNRQ